VIWNDNPKHGESAVWSGGRDQEGYATGFGTLTWYRLQTGPETGKATVRGRYFGNMVRGKFEGAVNLHANGKTAYAIFSEGGRTTRWVPGAAPSRIPLAKHQTTAQSEARAEGPRKEQNVAKAENDRRRTSDSESSEAQVLKRDATEPETRTLERSQSPEGSTNDVPSGTTVNKKPRIGVDHSIRSLVNPPSSLRSSPTAVDASEHAEPTPGSSTGASAHLTREEVIDLADAEVHTRGYDLAEYERSDPKYNVADNTWSLFYNQKPLDAIVDSGYGLNLTVDDRTKKTRIVTDR
jgi:hypothetical protein